MSPETLRFGIVGCGNIAARHAESLRHLDGALATRVWEPDLEKAARFGREHDLEVAPSYEAMLEKEVDVVIVAAPTPFHAELARAATRAGRHVLVEKPIDNDLDAARALVRDAQEAGVVLSVVSQHRFHDDVAWLRGVLDSGALGRPISVHVASVWSRDQAYYQQPGRGGSDPADGGVLINQAVHAVDLMLWLLGPASDVTAHQATLTHEIAVEDSAVLCARLASGALATLVTTTSIFPQEPERFEIRCEHGSVVVQGGRVTSLRCREGIEISEPPSRTRADDAEPDKLEPFRRQHRDVCRAVSEGGAPLVTGPQSLEVLAFIQGAYRAHSEGRRVDLAGESPGENGADGPVNLVKPTPPKEPMA